MSYRSSLDQWSVSPCRPARPWGSCTSCIQSRLGTAHRVPDQKIPGLHWIWERRSGCICIYRQRPHAARRHFSLTGHWQVALVLAPHKCRDISQLKMAASRVICMKANIFSGACQLGKLCHYVRAVAISSLEDSVIPTPERVHTTSARPLSFEL